MSAQTVHRIERLFDLWRKTFLSKEERERRKEAAAWLAAAPQDDVVRFTFDQESEHNPARKTCFCCNPKVVWVCQSTGFS
eukprot:5980494-Amphidinium_carterae.1